ncbi:lytic murein transglycosylase [Sinorhizobium medicae]|uniref:Lytic murein transglycosylase n=2 Tax=Sinorhizobium medicae TaxID=110321 RepID=A0A6G1WL78_9HYPH|nr:lytic murein transglycosylase [Sinorhizobium medicae]ABR62254.1 lytic murein transglycosylase [Sinorhizobium medicae WSM419]MBO1940867.1 lytic murein transglycosylase [Sinorhizobium medicae]MBO1964114.1 lytic murein transglycosylase [Sinorhizobium medicae]MDX0405863.1 lytic murein transglycosylase [Sinorhizobium medicae]MDX0411424.1 lytic murein transglycosylase [Sinorhizobium medicae]
MLRFLSVLFLASLFFVSASFAASRSDVEAQFRQWLQSDLWPEAQKAGVSSGAFKAAFKGVRLNWDLPDLAPPGFPKPKQRKQSQAEFSSPGSYFSEKRLQGLAATGRSLASTHASTLKRIERTYGVPGTIVLAIWGKESGFGRAKIPHPIMDVLATKAFMSTRPELFRRELIAALHILDSGDVKEAEMRGSWAGAMGQPQFLPTSFLKYAVDFDGDGRRDIWNSVPDSLASIASYLAQKGWQRGRDWGFEVAIPSGVSCAQEGPDLARPIAEWAGMGIGRVSGKPFPAAERGASGMMLVPAGTHGPQFIVTPNFYVIKEYNNSDLYALYIGNLADRIATGGGAFRGKWGDVGGMLRSDVLGLQKALVAKGYDVGKADGLPGYKTRRSLGDWQAKNGLKPTCFPDVSLKAKLR